MGSTDVKADSYYEATRNWSEGFSKLAGQTKSDVCVVGGGLTGISAALELSQAGFKVSLLESHTLGWGASGRSGGQIIPGLACQPSVIDKQLGFDDGKKIYDITVAAVKLLYDRVEKYNIDCDLSFGHLLCADKRGDIPYLHKYIKHIESYDYRHSQFVESKDLPRYIGSNRYVAAVATPKLGGHLHTLNYTLGLARVAVDAGVSVYENTPVTGIEQNRAGAIVRSDNAIVQCRFVVMAGNAYLDKLMPELESKKMAVRTYITTTNPLDEEQAKQLIPQNYSVEDNNFVLDYYRLTRDRRLLFGGLVSYSLTDPAQINEKLFKRILRVFPQLTDTRQDFTWGGEVAITRNRAPHIGRIGERIYFAQGYSGHGVAMSGMAGYILAQSIRGHFERFDLLARIKHKNFPGNELIRRPLLVLAMMWYRLRDLI